jgi:hypothetical protein
MGRFSVIHKKEQWSATWLGNLLIFLIISLLILIFLYTIHPFLAKTKTIESKILAVEGFIPDFAIEESKDIFEKGDYALMIITGKPRLKGAHLDIYDNDGLYSAATLSRIGFDSTKIQVVAIDPKIIKNRTYQSAINIKKWLLANDYPLEINLVSIGCHARRSQLLFEKAIGQKVGIIAVEDIRYDPDGWWKTSFGFRSVLNETIAYLYARFFFYP